MPRMREAIRSGWKTSSLSNFSPTPMNLMGIPVTATIERAAPGVSVQLGQNDRGQADPVGEGLGALNRVLPGHGVPDIDRFNGRKDILDDPQLVHQFVVDVKPSGRVDKQDIVSAVAGILKKVGQGRPGLAMAAAVIS